MGIFQQSDVLNASGSDRLEKKPGGMGWTHLHMWIKQLSSCSLNLFERTLHYLIAKMEHGYTAGLLLAISEIKLSSWDQLPEDQ